MARCPNCRKNFREPEGERGEHACPRCGLGPEDHCDDNPEDHYDSDNPCEDDDD